MRFAWWSGIAGLFLKCPGRRFCSLFYLFKKKKMKNRRSAVSMPIIFFLAFARFKGSWKRKPKMFCSHSDFPFAPRVNKQRQRSRAALILLQSPSNIEQNTGYALVSSDLPRVRRWSAHLLDMTPARPEVSAIDGSRPGDFPAAWCCLVRHKSVFFFYWVFVNWSERASHRPNWFSSLWSWDETKSHF